MLFGLRILRTMWHSYSAQVVTSHDQNYCNPSIHIYIKVLSVSYSIGLAAPGYVEHWISMHLCLVGQRQPCHTYWHQSSHIQTMSSRASMFSSAGNRIVHHRFVNFAHCKWPYPLNCWQQRANVIFSMPSFCSNQSEGASSLSLMPQIHRIMRPWLLPWSPCPFRGSLLPVWWDHTEAENSLCQLPRQLNPFLTSSFQHLR